MHYFCVTQKALQLSMLFFSLSPSRQCFRYGLTKAFFFFYTSNSQGLTIQQYKNKKNSKIKLQNKTQTLTKSYTFLNRVCTRREHININNYNNYNNSNNKKKINKKNKIKKRKKERKKEKREREKKKEKKERIKTINIYWGIKGFNEKLKTA